MNLVQKKHIGFLKATMRDFNAQMIATPKLEGVAKKHIFLDGLQM
jgi:hypothetical protein